MNAIFKYYSLFLLTFLMFLGSQQHINSAPPSKRYPQPIPYGDETSTILRELKDSVEELRHDLNNHEAEIRAFEEKFNNYDVSFESIHQQMGDKLKHNQELIHSNVIALEEKIISLESSSKSLVADMKQLKSHANEVSASFSQNEDRMRKLEKAIDLQNQNIANLERAVHALMEAIQVKETPIDKKATARLESKTGEAKAYRVKSGDSLAKIASEHQTTVKAIKEYNQLTKDQIIVGQILLIP